MEWFLAHWQLIIAIILGVYEVFARLIPTVKDISILSWFIAFLRWLSDNLNNRKRCV